MSTFYHHFYLPCQDEPAFISYISNSDDAHYPYQPPNEAITEITFWLGQEGDVSIDRVNLALSVRKGTN